MEKERYINNLIDIMRSIYEEYRESKLPRFIKQRIYDKRKKRVYEIIKTLSNRNCLSTEILIEYLQNIYLEFPPFGEFQHTKAVHTKEEIGESFTATIEVPMRQSDTDYMIICHIYYTKEDHSLMGIYNCMDINKRQKVFSFTDPNMRGMIAINSEVSHKTHMFDVSIEGDIMRNCFIETMVRDIDQYLRYKIDFFDERKDMT